MDWTNGQCAFFWVVGLLTLALFGVVVARADFKLDSAMLGLFTLGLACISLAVIQPESIKLWEVELGRIKREADAAVKLSMEATAMNIWNAGRWGGPDPKKQEKAVDEILERLYGDKAEAYKTYAKKMGIYLVPEEEKKALPDIQRPNVKSELFDKLEQPQFKSGG